MLKKIFDPKRSSIDEFFDEDPPKRKFLVKGHLPYVPYAILCGPGGSGKGMCATHLAISVATGIHLWGNPRYRIPKKGKVILATLEDDRAEMHRRVRACFAEVTREMSDEDKAQAEADLRENLIIPPLAGHTFNLYPDEDGKYRNALIDFIKSYEEVRLVILDPTNLILADDLSKNEVVSRFAAYIREINRVTKAMVMILTHSNKASMSRSDEEAGDAASVLGAVSFVNTSRVVLTLVIPSTKYLQRHKLTGDRASYALLRIPKANYLPPTNRVILLHRQQGGALREVPIVHPDPAAHLKGIVEMVRESGEIGKTDTIRNYMAKAGVSRATAESALSEAIRNGLLVARKGGKNNMTILEVPEESEPEQTAA